MRRIFSALLAAALLFALAGCGEERPALVEWAGEYSFYEFAPPDQNMAYRISVYQAGEDFYADMEIDGFQTMARRKAKLAGGAGHVQFVCTESGGVLLSFSREGSDIVTAWGVWTPMLRENTDPGIYFEPINHQH